MIADYYSDGFDKKHNYGSEILVGSEMPLYISMEGNVRATIKADRIETTKNVWGVIRDRTPPALFWEENLVSSEKGIHTFETKYVGDSEQVLPISYIKNIPERLRQEFLAEVPVGIHQLVNKLVGKEKETRKILRTFHEFVNEHEQPLLNTNGKPLEQLFEEYNESGVFHGNCKEARDFYMALCNAAGYPTKRVQGKSLNIGGHTWADVFVPMENGYGLIPADATLKTFGIHHPRNHLLLERAPKMSMGYVSRFMNRLKRSDSPEKYRLKIERMY